MQNKTYITRIPDKVGAFMLASKIILESDGNITRVSYNKAVDMHTIFIDVKAEDENLDKITVELEKAGYLNNKIYETRVIVVEIKIKDISGGVYPVLEILNRYKINISYINSFENGTPYQNFRMGLLIENPNIIKQLLEDVSKIYQIDIIDYDDSESTLDNTIFYIRMANDMQRMLALSMQDTMEFISEANRILQVLEKKGKTSVKVFDYVRQFANFISTHKGDAFKADISCQKVSPMVTMYTIEPPCGSNTYILDTGSALVIIDTGYAVYADEMLRIFSKLFPDWDTRKKSLLITHADVDHCGLLSVIQDADIYLNQKSADSLQRQLHNIPDYREENDFCMGYSKLSRIISSYKPPKPDRFHIIGGETPKEHNHLLRLDDYSVGDMSFEVFEGSGGHLYGEMVFLCRKYGIIFTGDIIVNISGFSKERANFNALAPYLMTSVNVNSAKASEMRNEVLALIKESGIHSLPYQICGGHGPIGVLNGCEITTKDDIQHITL